MNTFLNILRLALMTAVMLSGIAYAQEDEIRDGKMALEKGDLSKAIEMFRKATQEDKKTMEAYILLAQTLLKADSTDAVTAVLVLAKDLDPNYALSYVLQGDVYSRQKIYAAAILEYKKATELDSTKTDVWLKLAEAERKNRSYTAAAKTYQMVLKLDSMNVTALRQLGTVYYRGKLYLQALPYVEKLVKVMPDTMDFQVMFVKCLFEARRYEELIPIAESLLAKDASLTETEDILNQVYSILKMNRKVIDSYKDKNPETLKMEDLVRYVKALQSEGVNDTAETIYNIIFKKDSTRCDLRYYFGTNEMKLKKWPEAVVQFEKKIACDTSSGFQFASHLNAAMSLMQLKKFKDALEHTKAAIDHRPDNVQAWTVLAECYGQMEQNSDEVNSYKKVIALATGGESNGEDVRYATQLWEAYRMVGIRLLIRGSDAMKNKSEDQDAIKKIFGEAIPYLLKALALKPGDCEVLFWLGQSYQNINNKEEAIKYYKRTISSCPTSKQAEQAKPLLKSLGVDSPK